MTRITRLLLKAAITSIAIEVAVVAAQPDTASSGGPPPLEVDKSAPLLLDESTPPASPHYAAGQKFTMPRLICNDCHGDFLEDSLAVKHAQGHVTCVNCHGLSGTHATDESNTTPPDKMFARDVVAAQCQECHRGHDAPAVDVIIRWQQRGLQNLNPKDLVCTDCHGQHRMKVRTVHWDKKTRAILSP